MTACADCTPVVPTYQAPVLDTETLDAAIGQEAPLAAPKPPPQVLGVAGIAEQPIVIHDAKINWAMVAALPPFQMFLAERDGPNQTGQNSQQWATGVAMRLAAAVNDQALFDEYTAWHAAKGYWPNETPMGQVKE